MGKSSQLSQLKASLASSGLSRTSQPGANSTRKRTSGDSHPAGGAKRKRGKDEEKALEKIRRDMNPFEERVMRVSSLPSASVATPEFPGGMNGEADVHAST